MSVDWGMLMPALALVRHGQSLWNLQNRFTGWVDVPLTSEGRREARRAGELLRDQHASFDIAYTSVLCRARDTLTLLMEAGGFDLPIIADQALNERFYGDLQGLNKADTASRHGDEQVHAWRRSFSTPPPNGESLKMTAARTLPFFDRAILGDVAQGNNVLVVGHGNSNRAIVMQLDGLDEDEVPGLELATGVPLVYDLDRDGTVRSRQTLDAAE